LVFAVLVQLLMRPGELLTRDQLLERRGASSYSGTNDQKIFNLEGVMPVEVTVAATAKRFRL
jgi:hypothetical protein